MKRRILGIVLSAVLVLTCGFAVSGEQARTKEESQHFSASLRDDDALYARVENMISHNFVYNDDFDDTTTMVDNAILALIDKVDDDGFINSDVVLGFVYNMYGITLNEYAIDIDFPQKDGSIYVIPRGFDCYSHEITEIREEDNYLHVDSVMTVLTHEGYSYSFNCRTMLKRTAESSFGYIIVSATYY